MYRYFLELSYNGKHFHGWQIQQNAVTVQEELENALSTLLRMKIQTMGAGRTDTGVHARYFIAHFDSKSNDLHTLPKLIYKLNKLISPDIHINRIIPVKPDAHARFDAFSRTYKYYISTKKDPFNRDFCFEFEGLLDIDKMNEAAALLMKYKDFKSFCKLHSDVKTTYCNIIHSAWEYKCHNLIYTITADRFLRNMVRALVGTMFEVGRNKMTLTQFKEVIESGERGRAGASVLAKGLFLEDIQFPESIFEVNY